jgi:hypothetical protein
LKKILIAALLMTLAGSYSCKKQKAPDEVGAEASPGSGSTVPGKDLDPETYFNFKLELLALDNEVSASYLSLLRNASQYDSQLESRISELERKSVDKYRALRTTYRLPFSELGTMERDRQILNILDGYLSRHPDVRDRLLELQQTSRKLEEEINQEENRLHPRPVQPAPVPGGSELVQPIFSASVEKLP